MPLRGTVIDNKDPFQRGRCRVRVWGMHKEDDPNLPWAETMGSTAFGLHKGVGVSSVLQEGTTVWVEFEQSDLQCPIIVGVFVGHDAETMGEVSSDNSDFHPDAKGANYGLVQLITTPGGNRLEFNDADKRITLKTACGPELTLDCGKKQAYLTNGNASMTMDGNNIKVDGHMQVTGSVTAPNLCYCGSPGTPSGGRDQANRERNERCGPTVVGDDISCNGDLPANNDITILKDPLQQILQKAQEYYITKHEHPMQIFETVMSPERYLCLSKVGVPVYKEMLHGYGISVFAHNTKLPTLLKSPDTPGMTSPTGDGEAGNATTSANVLPEALKYTPIAMKAKILENYRIYGWCQLEKDYGLPKGYLAAIHAQETGNQGDACRFSPKGAAGPFQIMPIAWKDMQQAGGPYANLPYNPNSSCSGHVQDYKIAAKVAAWFIGKRNPSFDNVKNAIAKWGNEYRWSIAASAYNGGHGIVKGVKTTRNPATGQDILTHGNNENGSYIKGVMGYLRWFQENHGDKCS